MIHLLVVDRDERALETPSSFEVLRARSADEALEKLARNRRIDAVLFTGDALARETIERLSDEDASSPPLFSTGCAAVEGAVALESTGLFDELRRRLGE
jgi:hypothetical protein